MQLSTKQRLWGSLILTFALLLFERFFLAEKIPWLSNMVKVDPNLMVFHYAIPLPRFGVLPVLIIVFGALFVALIPYKNLKSGSAWKAAVSTWTRTFIFSLIIPVLLVLGAFCYFVLKDQVPNSGKAILESFGIEFTPIIFGTPWPKVDGSIASIAGLLAGIYLVYKFLRKEQIDGSREVV